MKDASGKPVSSEELQNHLDTALEFNIFGGITSGGLPVMLTREAMEEESGHADAHFLSAVDSGIIKLFNLH